MCACIDAVEAMGKVVLKLGLDWKLGLRVPGGTFRDE